MRSVVAECAAASNDRGKDVAREVSISREGSAQVVRTMHELGSQTSHAHSFVGWNSAMEQTDAFRGFLGLFKGEYTSAYTDLLQCLDDAYHAAFELEDAIADARRDILRADRDVTESQATLQVRTEQVQPGTGPGMDVPGWSDPVKGPLTAGNTVHSALNSPEVDDAIRNAGSNPPQHAASHTPTHSPLAPLDALEATMNVVHHAGENNEAQQDEETMQQYLDRKRRER
jgi:hypothetical protein